MSTENPTTEQPNEQPQEGTPTPTDPQTNQTPQEGQGGQQDGGKTFPESHVKDLRTENAARRKENESLRAELDALKQGLGKVFGFGDDGGNVELTVEQVQAERDTLATERDQLRQELTAYRAAAAQGVNADRLLDSRSFITKLNKLDASKDSYESDVEALIKTTAQADPSLQNQSTPSSSGTHEHQGNQNKSSDATDPSWFQRTFYANK